MPEGATSGGPRGKPWPSGHAASGRTTPATPRRGVLLRPRRAGGPLYRAGRAAAEGCAGWPSRAGYAGRAAPAKGMSAMEATRTGAPGCGAWIMRPPPM
ncbi:hypothetical protein TPA0910_19670 [Streptomyces hygroscopicus subsp. sporocinereus]|uniref:Uncharacterized protein n=1 Tax=Streptomyces hygroscopicus TaxID=1912 RepID=A0ABQ3TW58_STRHY|nr:hypothetical protein TPA0910_19670 [Streptomyces hygroscopicus]